MTEFRTSDIILAACLKIKEIEMVRIEISGTKGTFVFANADQEYIDDYYIGKCLVEPVIFNQAIRGLTTAVRRKVSTEQGT